MHEHEHFEDDAVTNRDTQHEQSDINVRALLVFFVVFVGFAIFTHFVIWFLYKGLVHWERVNAAPPVSSVKAPADASIPAQPRLQPFPMKTQDGRVIPPYSNTPATDLLAMRHAEAEQLGNYGWVNQQTGSVRLPIEVAKQLALQRGGFTVVPANATGTAATQLPGSAVPSAPGAVVMPPAAAIPASQATPVPATSTPAPAATGVNP